MIGCRCDKCVQDIVEQSGRPIGLGSGGGAANQEHALTAGVKRRRGELDGMGHDGMPTAFGSDKQHATW